MAKQLTLVSGISCAGKTSFVGVLTGINNLLTADSYAGLHGLNIKRSYKQLFDNGKDFVYESHLLRSGDDEIILQAIEKNFVINTFYIFTDNVLDNILRNSLNRENHFSVSELQEQFLSQSELLKYLKEISNRIIFFDSSDGFKKSAVYSDNVFTYENSVNSDWLNSIGNDVFGTERVKKKAAIELDFLK